VVLRSAENITNPSVLLHECEQGGSPCFNISDVVEGSNPSIPGDSGGPVFSGSQAFGLTTATNGSRDYFTKVANVLGSQGVRLN